MPYEEPPQDNIALCGTCWMFTGIFILVLGLVLTALGYIEHHVLAFRIAGPCFIGGSAIMLTGASTCCVSAHRKDRQKTVRKRSRHRTHQTSYRSSHQNSTSHSCRHHLSTSSEAVEDRDRDVPINIIPRVEVVPPAPQQHQPNANPLAGLTFVSASPQRSGMLGTIPISDEEMLSDYDNVPKKQRGRHSQQNREQFTIIETEMDTETSALLHEEQDRLPADNHNVSPITVLLSPDGETDDINAEPPPSYEDVMAHSP